MRPTLQFRLSQTLKITPHLQQAIGLLQLSALELELEIQTALEQNPFLEKTDSIDQNVLGIALKEMADPSYLVEQAFNNNLSTFKETVLQNPSHWNEKKNSVNAHDSSKSMEFAKDSETPLQDHLLWQKGLAKFTPEEDEIADTLIDSILEDGYLGASLKEIQDSLVAQGGAEITLEKIEAVLHKIQEFEPLGIGARTLSECLLLQLNAFPKDTPWILEAKRIAQHYLPLLGKKAYARLKSRLNIQIEGLKGAISILTSLNPKPGYTISAKKEEFIIPDIIVMKQNDVFWVQLNMNPITKLKINSEAVSLLKGATTSRERSYFKNQVKEARWFLKSLQTRQETLLKVSACIVQEQKAFFELGEEAMKPMSLQKVANLLGLHESTVSRITTQKYMDTPRGIFELKYFFSNSIQTQSGDTSAMSIKAFIKKTIDSEPPHKPYSDSYLTDLLGKEGITLARRTVSKYREGLNIAPAHQRKNLQNEL